MHPILVNLLNLAVGLAVPLLYFSDRLDGTQCWALVA